MNKNYFSVTPIIFNMTLLLLLFSCEMKKTTLQTKTVKVDSVQIVSIPEKIHTTNRFTKQDSTELHAIHTYYFGKLRSEVNDKLALGGLKFSPSFSSGRKYEFRAYVENQSYFLEFDDERYISELVEIITYKYGKPRKINEVEKRITSIYKVSEIERKEFLWLTKYKKIILGRTIRNKSPYSIDIEVTNLKLEAENNARYEDERRKTIIHESEKL